MSDLPRTHCDRTINHRNEGLNTHKEKKFAGTYKVLNIQNVFISRKSAEPVMVIILLLFICLKFVFIMFK